MSKRTIQVQEIAVEEFLREIKKAVVDAYRMIYGNASVYGTGDEYITREQVAAIYGITLSTVHSWMNSGILKPYKISKRTRFLLSEVKSAASEPKVQPPTTKNETSCKIKK